MLADKLPSREMILAELEYRATHRIESFYPETGPLRRELYFKHMDFFEAGARHNERLFLGGNRVGKSEGVGAYECVLHLTGKYPAWWRGRRFAHPVAVWAAGKDAKTTRDILQLALLGSGPQFGTGMLPADTILGTTPKPGVPEGVETVYVRHISGGRSEVQLKSYDSGVESFYGTRKHVCWLDEECEPGIYSEVLMRTLSTVPGEPNGIVLATLTPLWGMTALVRDFLEAPKDGPKYFTQCTWDEAPHLFRCESAMLRTHWVLVVMDQYTRRIIGFGVHAGMVDGVALCRMFNRAIQGQRRMPNFLSSNNDPLYRFHQWQANLRILDVTEIKSVPYVPLSHPFVERLIGTVRREYLDHILFWTAADLENKLLDFRTYFNNHRTHTSMEGRTPNLSASRPIANLRSFRWQPHCRSLYQTPVAA